VTAGNVDEAARAHPVLGPREALTGDRLRMTLARILVFETVPGAQAYLGWLEDHVDDVIGNARPVDGLSVPDGTIVFVHQPNPCCHSETRLVLVAWKEGDTVKTLELGGQVVKPSVVPELISSL
jgi:hypothetical protein